MERVSTLIERYVTGTWSDISAYVVSDLEGEYLIPGNSEIDLLASVGQLKFVVDNKTGLFSPNQKFQRGTPVRVTATYDGVPKVRFLGNILNLDPDTEEWGNQFVRATAVDWLNFAVDHPMIVPQLQANMKVGDAVAYILTQMDKQPESVVYYDGRETFDFVFDTIKKETRAYTELNKLALSEFAPIYMRAGNVLVVESADTRSGARTLTQIPVRPSDLHAILTDPNGGAILTIEGTNFAILADELFTPNIATGTVQQMETKIENGDRLTNRVTVRAYPSRTDASPVKLFQMDVGALTFPALGSITIRGNYANPDGGEPINALTSSFTPMITGTNYVAFNELGQDISTHLAITERYGTEGFEHTVTNTGEGGFLTKFDIYGKGIYPYNPIESVVSVTGSISSYGLAYMQIDQKYQDEIETGVGIAQKISDDEKEPRNDLISITFDASSASALMQASQYIDNGDLVWIKNVKPAVDTYAYIRGKKFVITPAGQVTETWYLKETDSLRKGLHMIAIKTVATKLAIKQGINFGLAPHLSNLPQKTITARYKRDLGFIGTFPFLSKYNGTNGWFFFIFGTGRLYYRENFTPSDGFWITAEGGITGTNSSTWHTLAMSYDNSSPNNNPSFYLDGVKQTCIISGTPAGTVDTDERGILTVANVNYPNFDYLYNMWGSLKDVRLYNRILSNDEIALISANHTDYLSVSDGLVFQAPCVKTEDYAGITGAVLYSTNLLIDNAYGARGIPNWNVPSGTIWQLKAYDDI